MRVLLAAVILTSVMAFDPGPTHASVQGSWCTSIQLAHSEFLDCHYRTFAECYPNILGGNRGFCVQNPHWGERELKPETSKRHRKHRVNRD
jgi:hypothetical protein